MHIYVKTLTGHAITYSEVVELSTTIQQLKERLCTRLSGYNVETACLTFNKEQLDDRDTIADCNIKSGSILELIEFNERYRSLHVFYGLKFVDVSKNNSLARIEWAKTAPRWRKARRGLCLEGQCNNSSCEAFNHTVIISLGFRRFDMLSDANPATTKCPICKQYVEPVTCSFNNCSWRYEGIKCSQSQAPESCSCDWTHTDDAYYRFDEKHGEEVSWRKLVFEVVERISSEVPFNPVELERETEDQTESLIWMPSTELNISTSVTPSPQSRLATAPIAVPASNQVSSSIEENTTNVNWFTRQGKFWCPWRSNSCTNQLPIRGQGVIEIMQRTSIPFELHLSNKSNPHDSEAYSIILSVNKTNVKLRTSTTELCISTESFHILQTEQECWHRYWISLYAANKNVQYGIGEIRPLFSIFNINIPEMESRLMKDICYLHVKLNNNESMLTELTELQNQIRFYMSQYPIVYDYPLFVVPQDQYSLENYAFGTCIPPSKLEKPCKHLYDTIINFQLNTDDFPDLTSVIDKSIKDRRGWCHRKLIEKATRFGKSNIKATYLRLTVGEREGNAPGHTFVIEVWPSGHFSPIHNHGNAYSVIRVLYGEILVKLYPALTLNMTQYKPIEQICHEGTITWMTPSLNQTHQLKHVDLYGKCCITIQCYMYELDDAEHYEFFDYIANDETSIGHFNPISDMDFFHFKELMRQEKQHEFSS